MTFSYTTNKITEERVSVHGVAKSVGTYYWSAKTVTDIVETYNYTSLRVYPNPTKNQLRIMNYELREDAEIGIYDIVGKMVGAYPCGRPEMTIDVSHLANGMYFLKIDNKVVKFVKE